MRWKTWCALACVGAHASAADPTFPSRPIRFIVPNGAGGTTDLVARSVAPKLADMLGQQVVIDNRPGSGGILGTEIVAKAAPDGHTLLMGTIGNIAISPTLYRKLGYDSLRDFAPVTQLASAAYMVVVHPTIAAKSMKELAALAKAKPGALNFASAGSGTGSHLAAELFKSIAGVDIVHVPYKGSGPALNDVMGGRVELEFENVAAAPHVKSGKLRAIAVTGKRRLTAFPELPTFAEQGQSDFDVVGYWGFLAPAGVPADVVSILNRALVRVVGEPANRAQLNTLGLEAEAGTADEYGAILRSESAKWSLLIREANIKP